MDKLTINSVYKKGFIKGIARGKALEKQKVIDEFQELIEEIRSYKFGSCDADFVLDVLNTKIKDKFGK